MQKLLRTRREFASSFNLKAQYPANDLENLCGLLKSVAFLPSQQENNDTGNLLNMFIVRNMAIAISNKLVRIMLIMLIGFSIKFLFLLLINILHQFLDILK
jgi:hypothetical protein